MINKRTLVIIHDLIMSACAWHLAWLARFNFEFPYQQWELSLYVLPFVVVTQGIVSWYFNLYRGVWRFASIPDLWNIFRAAIVGALTVTLVFFITFRLTGIPRSILILYPFILMFMLGAPRLAYRLWKDRSIGLRAVTSNTKVLIVGAGRAGEMLTREMLRDEEFLPIGFVDDNPGRQNSELHGVRVLGTAADLPRLVHEHYPDLIVLAIPSASNTQMQHIVEICETLDVPFRTLPPLSGMVSGQPSMNELREVSIEDLLGRASVELDWNYLKSGIENHTVMVTGGGGSIGSELCAQIRKLRPAKLLIVERSEYNLYRLMQALDNSGTDTIIPVLGDINDALLVDKLMQTHRPDLLFHAAAYKHVPILENQVREAVRNNVLATRVLIEQAERHGCEKFILISTDKAVNPENVLGATKRIAEMLCETANTGSGTQYITVRFGNVLGSEGSVLPLFKEQIQAGGPVTVTDPDMTRYFMTIREACQLILQAGVMGHGGEIYVLDMGEPVRIQYLAEHLIKLSRIPGETNVAIEYTGARPGEKLHEELFYDYEKQESTPHKKIMLARHPQIDRDRFDAMLAGLLQALEKDEQGLAGELFRIIRDDHEQAAFGNIVELKKQ